VFVNRVLRKMNRRKKDEATGKWRRLHNEEIHDQIWETGLINSGFLWGYLREGYHFEVGGVDVRIELERRKRGLD
jgi:hypothetical protein